MSRFTLRLTDRKSARFLPSAKSIRYGLAAFGVAAAMVGGLGQIAASAPRSMLAPATPAPASAPETAAVTTTGGWVIADNGPSLTMRSANPLGPVSAAPPASATPTAVSTPSSDGTRSTNDPKSLAPVTVVAKSLPAIPTPTATPAPTAPAAPPFQPWWVQTFRSTHLWSGPTDKSALDYGVIAQGSYLEVVAPQQGSHLFVLVPWTKNYAYVDAQAVGPSGAPPPVISAPRYSQFDGTIWAESNCGPTNLSMGIAALGVKVDQITLRHEANQQMGFSDPNSGTTWESLAYAARLNGVSTSGLYGPGGKSYRAWTTDNLKGEFAKGHPVLLLVRYWDLPGHSQSAFAGDHYIVALGFDAQGNLVYNDSTLGKSGTQQIMTPAQLQKAWAEPASGLKNTAMALVK